MVHIGRLILGTVLFCSCADSEPPEAIEQKVEAVNDLVQPEGVKLGSTTTIIDIRKREEYLQGHLPGAHQLWRDKLQSDEYPFGGMCISKDRLRFLLDSIGCETGEPIVVYDAKGGCDAARLWWMLKYYGHNNVVLLDGGLQYWTQLGLRIDTGNTIAEKGIGFQFERQGDRTLIVNYNEVLSAISDSTVVLVDTRTVEEYDGSVLKEGAFYAGHIPGSINFDWGRCVEMGSDWKLKSNEAIVSEMVAAGIDTSKRIITYCHTGVRSAHTTFVMRELLEFNDVSNYDGSWSEWSYLNAEEKKNQ